MLDPNARSHELAGEHKEIDAGEQLLANGLAPRYPHALGVQFGRAKTWGAA